MKIYVNSYEVKAIADYTKAISLKPEYAKAYYNRGNAYRNLNKDRQAIADYKKAADLYQKEGKTKESQEILEKLNKLQ